MLFDSSRTTCVHLSVSVGWDASLALVLKKTGRFHPLAPSPFPPLIVASWVQADSSSCLFSLIYQARADKCKHLPEYPPHLGALGGWKCSIFYPIWWINALLSPGCLSITFCTVFFPKQRSLQPRLWTGVTMDWIVLWSSFSFSSMVFMWLSCKCVHLLSVLWCCGCCVHTRV